MSEKIEFDIHSFDSRVWAKAFCDQFPGHDEGLMIGWFANAIMAGYDYRDSLTETRDAAIRADERQKAAGWISVKERLPEKETESCSVDCIICEEDGYQTLAYRYYGKLNEDNDNVWYDRVCRRNITGTVTHWMPLPEPPAIVGKKEG